MKKQNVISSAAALLCLASILASCNLGAGSKVTTTATTTTTTTADNNNQPVAEDISVKVSIKDQKENAVANATVIFEKDGEIITSGVTDNSGVVTLTVKAGDYRVSFDNLPEGHLGVPQNVSISKQTAEFSFTVENNLPDGSKEKPFPISENVNEITIPANTTYNYVMFGNSRIFTIENSDLKVVFNDTEYLPDENGKISVVMENNDDRNRFTVSVVNATQNSISTVMTVMSPLGASDNPHIIEGFGEEQTAQVPREGIVYYKTAVTESGFIKVYSENPLNNISMINLTSSTVTTYTMGSCCEYIKVSAGDELQIAVASLGINEVEEIKFVLYGYSGEEDDAVLVCKDELSMRYKASETVYFAYVNSGEYNTFVIENPNVELVWNGAVCTPDQEGKITVIFAAEKDEQITFGITNKSESNEEITFAFKK